MLQGEAGIISLSGRQHEDPGKLHPPLGSSQLLGSSSTVTPQLQKNSSSLLQSAQRSGYKCQAYSPRLGPLGITRTTGDRQRMGWHTGLSSQHTRSWRFAGVTWQLLLSLEIQDNTCYILYQKRETSITSIKYLHKSSNETAPCSEWLVPGKRSQLHMQLLFFLLNLCLSNFLCWKIYDSPTDTLSKGWWHKLTKTRRNSNPRLRHFPYLILLYLVISAHNC